MGFEPTTLHRASHCPDILLRECGISCLRSKRPTIELHPDVLSRGVDFWVKHRHFYWILARLNLLILGGNVVDMPGSRLQSVRVLALCPQQGRKVTETALFTVVW